VLVLVGPSETEFTVHQSFICKKSAFFENALRGEWKEAKERVVRLPDAEPGVFEAYLSWVYGDRVNIASVPAAFEGGLYHNQRYSKLAKTWIFADSLLDWTFCDRLTDTILDSATGYFVFPPERLMNWIWAHTSTGSALRKIFVDICLLEMKPSKDLPDEHNRIPRQVLLELAARHLEGETSTMGLEKRHGRVQRKDGHDCTYHLHKLGEVCQH
jgi:hypothetical protein